jgi:putative hemolysin
MSLPILVAIFLASALASAFFSGSETALTSVADATVFRLKEEGRRGADRLERLRAQLGRTLSTLLVGNTVANIAAGSIGTAIAISLLGERWGVIVATIVTTFLLLVVAEVTPKTLAARRPEAVALAVAPAVELLVRILRPLTQVLSGIARLFLRPFGVTGEASTDVSEADVRSLISLSQQQGSLEIEEREILHRVLDFGDTPVRDAMVPRARMVTLPVTATYRELRVLMNEHRYSRYPVWRGSPDEIVGILHAKDLFEVTDAEERSFDMGRYLRPAVFVPDLKRSGDLFRDMRRRRFHMAVVVDELGAIDGLVALEDLIERMLGDIADEHDEPAARPVSDGTSLIVEGGYPLRSLERDLAISFEEPEAETVAGLLLRRFGRIPRTGARTRLLGLEFVVERASARAIERIRIIRRSEAQKRKVS